MTCGLLIAVCYSFRDKVNADDYLGSVQINPSLHEQTDTVPLPLTNHSGKTEKDKKKQPTGTITFTAVIVEKDPILHSASAQTSTSRRITSNLLASGTGSSSGKNDVKGKEVGHHLEVPHGQIERVNTPIGTSHSDLAHRRVCQVYLASG